MNIAGTEYTLKEKAFDIFVSGCTRNCIGCFNPEAQSFDFGEKLDSKKIIRKIIEHDAVIDVIRVMGGDLLCQKESEAYIFSLVLKRSLKKLHLYTGAELSEVPKWALNLFDVIKTGTYEESLKQTKDLASSNQKYNFKGIDY